MNRAAVIILALLLASSALARNKRAAERLSFRPDLPFTTVKAISYKTEAQEVINPQRSGIVTRSAGAVSGLVSRATARGSPATKDPSGTSATTRKVITLVQTPEREMEVFCGYKDYLGFEPHRGQIAEGYLLVETLYRGERAILKCDILENRPRK